MTYFFFFVFSVLRSRLVCQSNRRAIELRCSGSSVSRPCLARGMEGQHARSFVGFNSLIWPLSPTHILKLPPTKNLRAILKILKVHCCYWERKKEEEKIKPRGVYSELAASVVLKGWRMGTKGMKMRDLFVAGSTCAQMLRTYSCPNNGTEPDGSWPP